MQVVTDASARSTDGEMMSFMSEALRETLLPGSPVAVTLFGVTLRSRLNHRSGCPNSRHCMLLLIGCP